MSPHANGSRPTRGQHTPSVPRSRGDDHPGWPRVLGFGEDPLLWSIPLGGLLGARFRLHALVPIWILAEIIIAGRTDRNSLEHVVPAILLLMLLAFAREVVRVAYARRGESPVTLVVLWPMGALAVQSRGPMRECKPHLAPTAALVCVAIVMASLFMLAGGDPRLLWFNPLAPQPEIAALTTALQVVSWWGFYAAVVMSLANLLPFLPLDAGRLIEARLLRSRAAAGVLQFQVLGAAAVFVAAALADQPRVVIGSAVSCVACWVALRRLAFVPAPAPIEEPDPPPRAGEVRRTAPADSAEEVDRILAKVSAHGLASLSDEERAVLRRASARLRGDE